MSNIEIRTRAAFVEWARQRHMRPDWHEPDEQGITARVEGTPLLFDNAMGVAEWFGPNRDRAELHLILSEHYVEEGEARRGPDLAAVNLATLCAWASEPLHTWPDPPSTPEAATPATFVTEWFELRHGPVDIGVAGLLLDFRAPSGADVTEATARIATNPNETIYVEWRVTTNSGDGMQHGGQYAAARLTEKPGLVYAWTWQQLATWLSRRGKVRQGPAEFGLHLYRPVKPVRR